MKRNILYKSRCGVCEDREGQRRKEKENKGRKGNKGKKEAWWARNELEENMSENWRQQMLKRTENSKPSGAKPAKRRIRKDWREEGTHDWGQNLLMKAIQTRLKPWSWLELAARKIVVEVARNLENWVRQLEKDGDRMVEEIEKWWRL